MNIKKSISIFINPFISPIIIVAIIIIFLMVTVLPELSLKNEVQKLEKQALATTTKIRKIRNYYTSNVISKVKDVDSIHINYDHYTHKNTIPLPATLLHDLSNILPQDGIRLKMFSKYPFPNRANRILDDAEEKGLTFVEKNPSKVHTQVVKEGSREFLKVTVADVFYDPACVRCHNTRKDTPKNDWKIGDVRGALQVTMPMSNGISLNNQQTLIIFYVLMVLVLALGIHYGIFSYFNKKKLSEHNEELGQKVNERTKTLNEYKKAVDYSAIVSKTDIDGTITYVNDKFMKISQYSKEELIGKNHNIIRDPGMPDALFEELWNTIKAKKVWRGQISNRAKDGTIYYVSSTIIPILNSHDEIEEFLAVRLDVSDIVQSKMEAEKANSVKSTFLANISHEIRTPLNAIIGFSQVLSNSASLSAEDKKQASIIQSSANNLLAIINDILDVSKIQNGNFEVSIEDTDMHFICEHVVELFSKRAVQKNIKIIFNMDSKIPHCVQTDGIRIRQVLSNFLGNSIKFTPKNGTITFNLIVLEQSKNDKIKVRFEVIDTGIGISKENIENIFIPFVQTDSNSSRKYEGTGLGLSICLHIIKSLNSTIHVESEVEKGSKFWFDLEFDICDDSFFKKETYFDRLNILVYNQNNELYQYVKSYLEQFGDISNNNTGDIVVLTSGELNNAREKYKDIPKIVLCVSDDEKVELKLFENEIALTLPFYKSKIEDVIAELIVFKGMKCVDIANDIKIHKGNILVAEDNLANQELLKYILDKLSVSYEIVSDGQEAVNMFIEKQNYDLILMDINMPVLDGMDAFKQIRDYEKGNHLSLVPIIALTANAIKGDREKFLAMGMNGYLSKPIEIDKLEEVFDTYLKSEKQIEEIMEDKGGIEMLNPKEIADKLGVSESIGEILIKKFQEDIPKDLDELEKFILENDATQISAKAHFIKNSCLNLGLDDICKQLQEIETTIKDTVELQVAFQKLKSSIATFL